MTAKHHLSILDWSWTVDNHTLAILLIPSDLFFSFLVCIGLLSKRKELSRKYSALLPSVQLTTQSQTGWRGRHPKAQGLKQFDEAVHRFQIRDYVFSALVQELRPQLKDCLLQQPSWSLSKQTRKFGEINLLSCPSRTPSDSSNCPKDAQFFPVSYWRNGRGWSQVIKSMDPGSIQKDKYCMKSMWNLKYGTNELIYETEQTHTHREHICGCQGDVGHWERYGLGVWDQQIQIYIQNG